jgi:hypothetical protein
MKILIVHTFYRERGGEDTMVLGKMALLKDASFEVELLAFQNPSHLLSAIVVLFFAIFNVSSFFKTIKAINNLVAFLFFFV